MALSLQTKFFLDELCQRWNQSLSKILNLAIEGHLPLWLEVYNAYCVPTGYQLLADKDGISFPSDSFYPSLEVRPARSELIKIRDMPGPVLIVSELLCEGQGHSQMKCFRTTGESFGDISIIGIKPEQLFARQDDMALFEKQQACEIEAPPHQSSNAPATCIPPDSPLNPQEHPCHAPELAIAQVCWQHFFDVPGAANLKKIKKMVIKDWLQKHYPALSKEARERIARVVKPLRKKKK